MPRDREEAAAENDANSRLLPPKFPVWTGDFGVVNHGGAGGAQKYLPTVNIFKGAPGCYVACYSKKQTGSIYGVGGEIFVHGQVRVSGRYEARICKPQAFESSDISAGKKFKALCNASITTCKDDCWAGGDTGGWFGIQP
jgi:hypothetical protein